MCPSRAGRSQASPHRGCRHRARRRDPDICLPPVRATATVVPMDDALVEVAIDLGGRPYYRGPLPSSLYDHWMRSFADHARATLHLRVCAGRDRHHVVEAAFKALGLALHDALIEPERFSAPRAPSAGSDDADAARHRLPRRQRRRVVKGVQFRGASRHWRSRGAGRALRG